MRFHTNLRRAIFNYGGALEFDGESLMKGAFLNGPYSRSMSLTITDEINAVGIRFKPAGACHFMTTPLNEIKNSFIPCENKNLCDLNDYFYDEKNDLKMIQEIDSVMLKLFDIEKQDSFFSAHAVSIVNQYNGMLEINKLSSLLSVNQRKLERIFRQYIGISPAEYSRTIRVAHARARLKDNAYELSDIGLDLGFYDQAHFSRQFKSVVGIAPGKYRRRAQCRKLSAASEQ